MKRAGMIRRWWRWLGNAWGRSAAIDDYARVGVSMAATNPTRRLWSAGR